MIHRKIKKIIAPQTTMEGAGVEVKRSIGSSELKHFDPFLLLDHFELYGAEQHIPGFPMHPHRGIETVTYILDGEVNHKDSLGNAGTIREGDIQWMTAGKGIIHEEMPKQKNGRLNGFQLWVNLPAKLKMTKPMYQEIVSSQIPIVTLEKNIKIRVISGEVYGTIGPVTEIAAYPKYLDVFIPQNTSFEYNIQKDHSAFAYVFEGSGIFGHFNDEEKPVPNPKLVVFENGELIKVQTSDDPVRFLLVSGKPINEPIVWYGPFVMNTREEIMQAFRDYEQGTFLK